jgi:hypothetical protein
VSLAVEAAGGEAMIVPFRLEDSGGVRAPV